jgi:hypothetical protein
MISVYASEEDDQQQFARRAAEHFAAHPEHQTYTDEEIACDQWFAVRYGLGNDCVVVFKISDSVEPKNYMELVREYQQ